MPFYTESRLSPSLGEGSMTVLTIIESQFTHSNLYDMLFALSFQKNIILYFKIIKLLIFILNNFYNHTNVTI